MLETSETVFQDALPNGLNIRFFTMDITVKCFAAARDVLARDEFHMDIPEGTTIEVVEREIRKLSTQLAEMPFMLALNMAYPAEGTLVKEGDELAIIPPVSGG
ncbi:MoaD/ThiS family protein [Prosthecochloris sp.]|uniref:MoaD/ThiS family protein n=1 Tax=Prosthecochloris sp. TaxID=290513 RepID=UPI0025E979A0|nr:MoaD/ThiS family protein [Prosthecochloris sp.]